MLPLEGIRVLDFTRHLPGPYATDILCRLGAQVLKVEPPDGDPTRWLPPIVGDTGSLFHLVNAGKESVVVDLKSETGRAFAQRLAAVSDVVAESYRPEAAAELGIDADTLLSINPRLIYCSVSGYGSGDARSGHDLNFVALAGLLDLQRDREGRPILPSTQLGDMAGALFAALTILASLIERTTTGRGKKIDVSMSDATRAVMPTAEALYRGTHSSPSSFFLTGALPEYNVYQTADGKHLAVAPLEPKFWEAFCRAIGEPQLVEHQYDIESRAEVFETIRRAIASKSRSEWESCFADVDACVTPVLTIEESHQRFGDPVSRNPLQSNFPSARGETPKLGEHFAAIGLSADEQAKLRKSGRFESKRVLQKFVATSILKLRQRHLLK
ncbi:MAG: CoA transferase [Acidobacteria bacterium]|nr:CoA transferase [Acidobacteriota bacterium]